MPVISLVFITYTLQLLARMDKSDQDRIASVTVGNVLSLTNPDAVTYAAFDLARSRFTVKGVDKGPYNITVTHAMDEVIFEVTSIQNELVISYTLALAPFRPLIENYLTLIEKIYLAAQAGNRDGVETINHGRGALHDDGAKLVFEAMDAFVIDFRTARRIFTLLVNLKSVRPRSS